MTVPSLLMRQGDFSELLNPKNSFFGTVVIINDPKTGQPFPGNKIPLCPQPVGSCATPNGLGILNAYPAPNLATPLSNGKQLVFDGAPPAESAQGHHSYRHQFDQQTAAPIPS